MNPFVSAAMIAAAVSPWDGSVAKRSCNAILPDYTNKKQKRRLAANRIAKASRKRNRSKR